MVDIIIQSHNISKYQVYNRCTVHLMASR